MIHENHVMASGDVAQLRTGPSAGHARSYPDAPPDKLPGLL